MGYSDHDDFQSDAAPDSTWGIVGRVLSLCVRLLGTVLLAVGLWIGLAVVFESWALYQEPTRIERFVQIVEQGSGLDQAISSLGAGEGDGEGAASGLRLSYFIAWVICLGMLMVVGMLAFGAVSAGGRIALGLGGKR